MYVILFWIIKKILAEALVYACYLINRLPSSAIGCKTPLEDWLGKAAQDYDSLRVFGYPTYYHVNEDKLDPKSEERCVRRIQERSKRLQDLGS